MTIVIGMNLPDFVEYAAIKGITGSIQGDKTLNKPKDKAIRGDGAIIFLHVASDTNASIQRVLPLLPQYEIPVIEAVPLAVD